MTFWARDSQAPGNTEDRGGKDREAFGQVFIHIFLLALFSRCNII
jgi:hypothetical protein